jgi:hypothetical protein
VVDEREWVPRPHLPGHTIVELRIPFADARARTVVKQPGGRWNPARKTWHLRYDRVVANGLSDRICRGEVSTTICAPRARSILMKMPAIARSQSNNSYADYAIGKSRGGPIDGHGTRVVHDRVSGALATREVAILS